MRTIGFLGAIALTVAVGGCSARPDTELRQRLQALQQTIEQLGAQWQAQVEVLSNRVAALERQQERIHAVKTDAAFGDDMVVAAMTTLEDEVSRLARVLDTTGLEQVATNEVDPQALRDVLTEYSERRQIAQVQERLQQRNEELHAEDQKVYGEELNRLYEQARFRWGRDRGSDEEREKAFQELVQKYPDAHATAMIAAERAVGALFRDNIEDAERYYAFLQSNPKFAGTVTDWGVEAMPAIQAGLARMYLRQNRRQDAERLINDLEQNYGDSYIFTMGGGGRRGGRRGFEPRWERGSAVAQSLRERL